MNADNIYDYVVSDCDTGEEVIVSARDQSFARIKELEARVKALETFTPTGSRMLLVHRLLWCEVLNRQIKDKERIEGLERDAKKMDVAYDTKTRRAEALEAMLKIVTAELNDLRVVHWDMDDLQPEEQEDIDRIEKAINEADALLKGSGQ
jgi:predicted nucleic acid-binding Zn ribbon protein